MPLSTKSRETRPYRIRLSEQRGYIEGVTFLSAGKQPQEECHYFGGIPYALPPLGTYRWRKPRPLDPCYRYGTHASPGIFNKGAGLCPQPGFNHAPAPKTWDEDCLQCNIWIPAGNAPKGGWPILFYIHGGWLQIGSPNGINCTALLNETKMKCIVVCPAYRLGVLGFLAAEELGGDGGAVVGNFGFWDQRMALEWTWKNATCFGGNAGEITVGGYSAGAHSTFHQLAHDLYSGKPRIIKRIVMFSNGPGRSGPSPRPLPLARPQYQSLLQALHIPSTLPPHQILARLRSLPASTLIAAASPTSSHAFPYHEFRAVADGPNGFIPPTLFTDIDSGVFARKLKQANIQILAGECAEERWLYSTYRPPSFPRLINSTREEVRNILHDRLLADYTPATTSAILDHYLPSHANPSSTSTTNSTHYAPSLLQTPNDLFGAIMADVQVHALQRGFLHALSSHGTCQLIHRYRIDYRVDCADAAGLKREWGATHSSDLGMWFFGNGWGSGLSEREKGVVREWCEPVWEWMSRSGDMGTWDGARRARPEMEWVRCLRKDGRVEMVWDEDWKRGCEVWDVVRQAQVGEGNELVRKERMSAKL